MRITMHLKGNNQLNTEGETGNTTHFPPLSDSSQAIVTHNHIAVQVSLVVQCVWLLVTVEGSLEEVCENSL